MAGQARAHRVPRQAKAPEAGCFEGFGRIWLRGLATTDGSQTCSSPLSEWHCLANDAVLDLWPTRVCAASRLALLWQIMSGGVDEEFLTVRASLGRRPCEEVEDGLPDSRHARLWRRSPDSFFSVPLL